MDESGFYIGVDIGTSGCRAMAVDLAGHVAASASVPLPAPERDGDRVWQSPETWWRACREVLSQVAKATPGEIRALAVDGTSGTVLLADADGTPLGPALMYNAACRSEAERIKAVAPAESGAHGASSGLAKLLFLNRKPGAAYCLNQADWIVGRLTGRFGVSDENNSLKLGYDPVERRWPAWLSRLPVDESLLPRVLPPGTVVGAIAADAATATGLPDTVQVVAGTTDSIAAFLATGARAPGEAVTALGTTLAVKIVSEYPVFAPEFGIYSHRLGNRWLAGGASNAGGAVLLQHFSSADLDAMTPLLQPDRPTGLHYYPLPAPGERFPFNDPGLEPELSPRPGDDVAFFQAILEGLARIEALGYRRLQELGAPAAVSVRTTGGGAKNPAWTKIREGLLGVPMLDAKHQDAAYGSALLAQCLDRGPLQ